MKYTHIEKIGEGGLAEVWRVEDQLKRVWALKKLREGQNDKEAARFRQEVRIQRRLNHDGIVEVVSANITVDRPFYIMPLATGSLEDAIPEIVNDPDMLIPIAKSILSGLAHAHNQGVFHRDLKPSNILMFDDEARIADFGLGKQLDVAASYTTTTSDKWGTQWYSPPEQIKGLKFCDEQSDVFSMGKLFLHCLTGRYANHMPLNLDPRWRFLIDKCIVDDKEGRWSGAAELQRRFAFVFQIDQSLAVDTEKMLADLARIATEEEVDEDDIRDFAEKVPLIAMDEVFLQKVVDNLPEALVIAWFDLDSVSFIQLIENFDGTLDGVTSFEYCDVIADQYAMIYANAADPGIREMIRARLFKLGPDNNRWHVGSVLAAILATIRDPADIASVVTLFERDEQLAKWNGSYMKSAEIDKRIRDAIPKTE